VPQPMTDDQREVARAAIRAYFNNVTRLAGAISMKRAIWSVRKIIGDVVPTDELVTLISEQATVVGLGVEYDEKG
jgi:hypothetical protein